MYLWHENRTAATRTFRIRIRLASGTAKLRDIRHYAEISTADYLIVGRNLSCVYRYGNFNAAALPDEVGTGFAQIWTANVLDGRLVACVAEFTVETPSAPTTLVVQTCCDNGMPPGDVNPVPPVNQYRPDENPPRLPHTHIRGWWPYSEVTFPVNQILSADPESLGPPIECGVVELTQPDGPTPPELEASAFGHRGDGEDPFGTPSGNKGLYGAVVKYVFIAHNANVNHPSLLGLAIQMRNNGGRFSGVGGTIVPQGSGLLIPTLHANGNPKISSFSTGTGLGMIIEPKEWKIVECELCTAGACTLPVNLVFSASGINP